MSGVTIRAKSCNQRNVILNNVKAILFDLDGTLVNSLDAHVLSFQWIIGKLGKVVTIHELEKLMGLTPQSIIKKYFPDLSKDTIWQATLEKEEYLYDLNQKIELNDGVIKFLEKLGENRIKRIVISSTHRSLVNRLLNSVNLTENLDDMVCGDDIKKGKPNPEPFLTGLKKANVQKNEALGIGDSVYDGLSCKSAGIPFIGITTGKTECQTLLDIKVRAVIDNFSDLSIISN